jgi:predicted small metal-binding protein
MAKEFRCNDIVKGCSAVIIAQDEQEIMKKAVEHAQSAHRIPSVSPEMAEKVKSVIRNV